MQVETLDYPTDEASFAGRVLANFLQELAQNGLDWPKVWLTRPSPEYPPVDSRLHAVGNCGQCGMADAWKGTYTDMPPCPACGWRPNRSVLDEFPSRRQCDLVKRHRPAPGGRPNPGHGCSGAAFSSTLKSSTFRGGGLRRRMLSRSRRIVRFT
jgi:hypothetical protein